MNNICKGVYINIFWVFIFFIEVTCSCSDYLHNDVVNTLLSQPDEEKDVLICEKNWEDQFDYATILQVNGQYIMYYRSISFASVPHQLYCYAVSDDGIHWNRPNLGVFKFNGNRDNNIVTDRVDGVSVEYVDNMYYLLADRVYDDSNNVKRGLALFKSKDGIHFERDMDFDVPFFCDSQNELMWDSTSKTFKIYLRSWYDSINPLIEYNHFNAYRSVSLLESPSLKISMKPGKDARHFTNKTIPSINKELPVIFKNTSISLDYDIYCAYVNKYRKNLYIAYPINYYHTPNKKKGGKLDNDGYGTIGFWVSKDGRSFDEVKRDYITNGKKWIESCIGHIETKDMFIHYYILFNNTHQERPVKNTIRARIHYKKQKRKEK